MARANQSEEAYNYQEEAMKITSSHEGSYATSGSRRMSSSGPARGYREDYSRAQHAPLLDDAEGQLSLNNNNNDTTESSSARRRDYPSSSSSRVLYRSASDVGVGMSETSSQEHLRFAAHVNRFATHDPRASPGAVPNNKSMNSFSVSERIKAFNTPPYSQTTEYENGNTMQQQPTTTPRRRLTPNTNENSPQKQHPGRFVPPGYNKNRGRESSRQTPSPSSSSLSQPVPRQGRVEESTVHQNYQQEQQNEQEQHEESSSSRDLLNQPPTTPRSTSTQPGSSNRRSFSRERNVAGSVRRSYSRENGVRNDERRSLSPAAAATSRERKSGGGSSTSNRGGSPSRNSEQQRLARSLLAQHHRHLREYEKDSSNSRRNDNGESVNITDVVERACHDKIESAIRRVRHESIGRTYSSASQRSRGAEEERKSNASQRSRGASVERKSSAAQQSRGASVERAPTASQQGHGDSVERNSSVARQSRGDLIEQMSSASQRPRGDSMERKVRSVLRSQNSERTLRQSGSGHRSANPPVAPNSYDRYTTESRTNDDDDGGGGKRRDTNEETRAVSPVATGTPLVKALSPGRNTSDASIGTVETPQSASVQELKEQLWDNKETLQVAIKPSLHGTGYLERRTKQSTNYHAPEMTGRQGHRIPSLSPNPSRSASPAVPPNSYDRYTMKNRTNDDGGGGKRRGFNEETRAASPVSTGTPLVKSLSPGRNTPDASIGTVETPLSPSVQELKGQLWDNEETLQVAVKPSLHGVGYSERRTKQSTNYHAPEMAGRQGHRVRSLSPNLRRASQGREQRPATTVGASSSGRGPHSMFKSKFYQAAVAAAAQRVGKSPTQQNAQKPHAESSGRASPRDDNVTPQQTVERLRTATSAPQLSSSTSAARLRQRAKAKQLSESLRRERSASPHRLEAPASADRWESPAKESDAVPIVAEGPVMSPSVSRSSPSIERVPSISGVSSATGEPSVANLVARLASVRRDNAEEALKVIDSILRDEGQSSWGTGAANAMNLPSARKATDTAKKLSMNKFLDTDDDESSGDSSTGSSYDETSVSSITNPTYQVEKPPAHSTAGLRIPRPSSLGNYAQLKVSPIDESRGKTAKARKEKKPPPPSTISAKVKSPDRTDDVIVPVEEERKLDLFMKSHPIEPSNAAAIARKIKAWDEMSNPDRGSPNIPASPSRTVEDDQPTTATEELGSIMTPQSKSQSLGSLVSPQSKLSLGSLVSPQPPSPQSPGNRRSHPWDDHRPQQRARSKSPGRAPSVAMNGGGSAGPSPNSDARDPFETSSTWRRRKAAKSELLYSDGLLSSSGSLNPTRVVDDGLQSSVKVDTGSQNSFGPSSSGSRVTTQAQNGSQPTEPKTPVYFVDASMDDGAGIEVNLDARTTQSRTDTVESDSRESFRKNSRLTPSVYNVNRTRPAHGNQAFPSQKSDTSNVFDSAWEALSPDVFETKKEGSKSQPATPRARLPVAVTAAFSDDMDLLKGSSGSNIQRSQSYASDPPPRPPGSGSNNNYFQEEERAPPRSPGARLRRGFDKLRTRSSTPKKSRSTTGATFHFSPRSPKRGDHSKPLLSAYTMDSVMMTDQDNNDDQNKNLDEFLARMKRSKSPVASSRSRSNSLAGESETDSLTGSVRNKNLAKKFSRLLKVYEDKN